MGLTAVAVLGGFVGLDATSAPQVMLSRPIVAATFAGLLLGRPLDGLLIGVLLEAFALVILPIGAARYPEAGTAAVASTYGYVGVAAPGLDPPVLLMAVVFGLAWERVTGASVTRGRRLNERVVEATPRRGGDLARAVERRHRAAMLLDYLRGALVTVSGALVAAVVLRWLAPLWGLGGMPALGALAVAVSVMLAATLALFGGWRERRLAFSLGLLCGFLLILLR